jgi:DNA polymerase I-like protein with 3'-5' exonuclease and polymerase domains
MIRTPFGRCIQFFGPQNDKMIRDATAAEPQSTSADYLNNAIIGMDQLDIPEYEFLLQVHDSILCQVPDDPEVIYNVATQMKAITEITIDVHGIDLKIPCDFEIGYDWKSMHEIKNLEDTGRIHAEVQAMGH